MDLRGGEWVGETPLTVSRGRNFQQTLPEGSLCAQVKPTLNSCETPVRRSADRHFVTIVSIGSVLPQHGIAHSILRTTAMEVGTIYQAHFTDEKNLGPNKRSNRIITMAESWASAQRRASRALGLRTGLRWHHLHSVRT